MAEKIKIASFEIDNIDSLLKDTADLKTEMLDLRDANRAAEKSGKTLDSAYVENAAKLKILNTAYTASIKVLTETERKKNDLVTRGKELSIVLNTEVKSIDQARASNKLLNKLRNATNLGTKKGREELIKLNAQLNANNKFIKENVDQYAKQKIGIGDYAGGIRDALGESTLFGEQQGKLKEVMGLLAPVLKGMQSQVSATAAGMKSTAAATAGMTAAQKASAIASGTVTAALRVLKLALIATGIGAIVVLIGSLVAWLSTTQKGADFVSKAMAVLGAAFDVIIDRASAFIDAMILIASGDFSGGIDALKESFKGVGDEMRREIDLVIELENRMNALEDREISLITVQAERKKKVEELRFAAKDELKGLKERADLLDRAAVQEKAILADQISIAKEKASIEQAEYDRAKSDRKDDKKLQEAKAAVIELDTQSLKLQRSFEAEKQGLLKRARGKEKAAHDARVKEVNKEISLAIKESKTKLALFEARGDASGLSQEVSFAEKVRDERLKILESEIEAGKKTVTQGLLDEFNIKQDFLERQSELVVENASKEIDAYLFANRSRLDANGRLTDSLVEQEGIRLDLILEKQLEFEAVRLENGKISQQEYDQAVFEISEGNRMSKEDLSLELAEQRAETEAINLQNQRLLDEQNLILDFDLRKKYLDIERNAELKEAKRTGADVNLINKGYDQLDLQNKREVSQGKLEIANNVFSGLVGLLGKESAAGKAAAVAQAVINVAQGVTKAIAQGGLGGVLTGAIVAATGAVTIGKIITAKKPDLPSRSSTPIAEKGMLIGSGGLLHGPSHARGGINIEAEGGEWVLNRTASKMFSPLLSLMNEMGNGARGMNYTGNMADGGIVGRSITNGQGINVDEIVNIITESIGSIPVVNVASDTVNVASDEFRIAENASF